MAEDTDVQRLSQVEQGREKPLIRVNEKFIPFAHPDPVSEGPTGMEFRDYSLEVDSKTASFDLGIGDTKIPIEVRAWADYSAKGTVITPFHPENGYIIDQRDFDPEQRKDKFIREYHYDFNETIDHTKDPAYICAVVKPKDWFTFSQKTKEIFQRLWLQLTFPGSPPEIKMDDPAYRFETRYESKPKSGGVFMLFYPSDSKSLAKFESDLFSYPFRQEGFKIHVPADLASLQQIQARFILVPENEFGTTPRSMEPHVSS